MTETWLCAQGDKAKTVELSPSGFDVISFPRRSPSRGGGIAAICKSIFGSNITFKTNFDFTHTSFEGINYFFFSVCTALHQIYGTILLTLFSEQLSVLLDYICNLPGLVCLVDDMNIHFDNPQQSLAKQTMTTFINSHLTPATLAPAHTPCLFSIDLYTVRQHLVIACFLLLLLSGSLFQMMSGVCHHCHHLSLV